MAGTGMGAMEVEFAKRPSSDTNLPWFGDDNSQTPNSLHKG